MKKAVSFDDVLLVPRFSQLNSRSEANLSTSISGIDLKIPIIASPMSSVCESEMAIALGKLGGLGIIHRFCSIDDQLQMVQEVHRNHLLCGFAVGIGEDWQDRVEACKKYGSIICIDVAHGHHQRVANLLKNEYYPYYKDYPIIISQLATEESAKFFIDEVIPKEYQTTTTLRLGIGSGSLCSTRITTGFGLPTLQSILEVMPVSENVSIIADGGIKNSGDIVKSLVAGADAVMLGSLLAGTHESPGSIVKQNEQLFKHYRGSASLSDKVLRGELAKNIEGADTLVPYKGSVKQVIQNLLEGICSGFSYGGSKTLSELRSVEMVEISQAGYRESLPHLKL